MISNPSIPVPVARHPIIERAEIPERPRTITTTYVPLVARLSNCQIGLLKRLYRLERSTLELRAESRLPRMPEWLLELRR